MPIQTIALAGPVSYEVNGEQYIAVNAGWGGGRALIGRGSGFNPAVAPARMLVFKLGGNAELPPFEEVTQLPPQPPALRASEAQITRGAQYFAETCQLCHGQNAVGGQKDLRFMSLETHDEFMDIVMEGIREEKGMASFADTISQEQAEDIHQYLIARANEDWGKFAVSDESTND